MLSSLFSGESAESKAHKALIKKNNDVLDELDSRKEVEYIHWILEHGTGADRQLRAYHESGGDLKAVVRCMIEETKVNL